MERILCLDYGSKRIGVAISDPLGLTAQPQPYIPNTPQVISTIKNLIQEYCIKTIVLGLPKHRDGKESHEALRVRRFGEKLNAMTKLQVIYWDERYSTKASQTHLIHAGLRREKRKQVIDSQAASFILQGYLDRGQHIQVPR